MPYKVEYDKIEGFYLGFLGPSLSTLVNGGLANTEKAVNSLIVSANISGSTADRMREYFSDVHITALNMIKKIASLMVIQLQKYIYTYNALVDSHVNARFSSQEFCDIATELTGDVNHAEYIDNEIRRILADISPLYTPNNVGGYRGVYDSVQLINKIKVQLDTLDTQIKQIESEFSTTALSEIDMLLDLLESYVVNNAGHDSVYISSYHGEAKDDTYRALVRHEKTLSDYISEHSDDYVEINDYIRDRATARSQGEINVELRKDLKKAAQTVRIMGYVGDACIAIGKLALIAYGAPKPAVDVVGGAAGGAWKNWYTEISDEMESYNLGDGALVEKDKLVEKTIVGGVEGTATGLISVGTDTIFSSVGEAGFVGKLTNSDNPVIKHTTKIGLKYVEKEVESVEGGISKRYIEAKAEEITKGKTEDGRSAFEIAFDLETIKKEEIDEGGWAKTGAETLVSYTFSEISGEGKGTKDSSKSGLETYDARRTISKSSLKGAETILSETLGTGAKAMAATPIEGESRLEAGKKAVEELYTDETKREKMISKTAVKMASTTFDDIEKQAKERKAAENAPTLNEVMEDSQFFKDHKAGEYTFDESESGKRAYGVLNLADNPKRNATVQRQAGGDERRPDDDGGHIIGARFIPESGAENVDAQNSNLNRGAYKREENTWADSLKDGNNVYSNIETYKREGHERPDAYMGWTVTEDSKGQRHWDAFSFTNESSKTQDQWAAELEDMPDTPDVPNAMSDADYERIQTIADEET